MAGKHKKKNAQGHILFIVAWGDAYYIDNDGNIVDYNGVAVPKQLAEILKENHRANVVEDVEKAKSEPEPTPEPEPPAVADTSSAGCPNCDSGDSGTDNSVPVGRV